MKKIIQYIAVGFIFLITGCSSNEKSATTNEQKDLPDQFLVVLGTAQDAGFPQIGCTNEYCAAYWDGIEEKKHVTSLALVDRITNQDWLFEATPDITAQLHSLQVYLTKKDYSPDGVFITHAHVGHYTGLMEFGREAMGAKEIPVYAMPRLDSFIRTNGPWSQLVTLKNISLQILKADSAVAICSSFKVTPLKVPHRDEFSETVGFIIESKRKKILFIPDIDKWEKWERKIVEEVNKVDIALLDGTFYKSGELPGRDMSEVPHPFVEESMNKFSALPDSIKSKIVFIHFNHTNPLLKKDSPEKKEVQAKGFGVAEEGMVIEL
ncbi:MAG: pyrroloquinoline quinone biosynthesis protein PqqB [Chitinophagaceae bacterium]|nr:pyrroloquinoline quinone biosynthesis protein PqqB [Chitinophagaceae bacterium]